MTNENLEEQMQALASEIEHDLYQHFGPLLFNANLYAALGYPSGDAFRQALCRKTVPVEIFSIERRRGKFALSRDVALWLAQQRFQQATEKEN